MQNNISQNFGDELNFVTCERSFNLEFVTYLLIYSVLPVCCISSEISQVGANIDFCSEPES